MRGEAGSSSGLVPRQGFEQLARDQAAGDGQGYQGPDHHIEVLEVVVQDAREQREHAEAQGHQQELGGEDSPAEGVIDAGLPVGGRADPLGTSAHVRDGDTGGGKPKAGGEG